MQVNDNSERMKFYAPYGKVEEVGTNRVYVSDFADAADLPANLEAARLVAKGIGKDVYIRPHIQVDGQKNPELAIGTEGVHGDVKNYRARVKGREVPLKAFVKNGLRAANKQGCSYAVLNLGKEPFEGTGELARALYGELNGIHPEIKKVVIIRDGKTAQLSRREIEERKFGALKPLS